VNRGLDTAAKVADFQKLDAARIGDPLLLPNMAAAVARLSRAIDAGERIAVYGHHDPDGLCGAALACDLRHEVARMIVAQAAA
jgi:single-stranded-DNA-specific exonuclease